MIKVRPTVIGDFLYSLLYEAIRIGNVQFALRIKCDHKSADAIIFIVFRRSIGQTSLKLSISACFTRRRLSGEVENAHQKVVIDPTKPFPQPPSYENGSRP